MLAMKLDGNIACPHSSPSFVSLGPHSGESGYGTDRVGRTQERSDAVPAKANLASNAETSNAETSNAETGNTETGG